MNLSFGYACKKIM